MMDDMISRQAAIDALSNGALINYQAAGHNNGLVKAIDIIKGLPSAQPEPFKVFTDDMDREAVEKLKEDLKNAPVMLMAVNGSAQPEVTEEAVKDYCRKRCLTILTNDYFHKLTSAQAERQKGKWLRYGEDGEPNEQDTVFWQCDQCLEHYTGRTTRIPKYCPNCGCEMER